MIALQPELVEKPWGRTRLPAMFGPANGRRIGEVWFTGGGEKLPLLPKYIFTTERLSIQVHPNDEQARKRGFGHGKSECWAIMDAEPGATLGLGLNRAVGRDELRAAAVDGTIEQMMDWRPVSAGHFVFVPSGTIHAIGGGISLLEFQQNCDVTYRLYDYGRPRELHLDDGIAVADAMPFAGTLQHLGDDERTLVDGPHFTLVLSRHDALHDQRRWIMPIEGEGYGTCLLLEPGEALGETGARMLIGATSRS